MGQPGTLTLLSPSSACGERSECVKELGRALGSAHGSRHGKEGRARGYHCMELGMLRYVRDFGVRLKKCVELGHAVEGVKVTQKCTIYHRYNF